VNESLLNEIWEVIESFDKIPPKETTTIAVTTKSVLDLKRKLEDTNNQQTEKKIKQSVKEQEDLQCQDETNKFDWIDLIRNELMKREKYQVSLSKLSKKVKTRFSTEINFLSYFELYYLNNNLNNTIKSNIY
jgi:hypothetical protein